MKTAMLISLSLMAFIFAGCVTDGTGTLVLSPRVGYYEYWTGTTYIRVDPEDYYYTMGNRIYHHRGSLDIVINYYPHGYHIFEGRLDIHGSNFHHRPFYLHRNSPRFRPNHESRPPRNIGHRPHRPLPRPGINNIRKPLRPPQVAPPRPQKPRSLAPPRSVPQQAPYLKPLQRPAPRITPPPVQRQAPTIRPLIMPPPRQLAPSVRVAPSRPVPHQAPVRPKPLQRPLPSKR